MGHKGVVSGHTISFSIPRLMGDQRDPRVLECHTKKLIVDDTTTCRNKSVTKHVATRW